MKYHTIVCGGTFDLLHKGHKSFIEESLKNADKAIIGITSDSYVYEFKSGDMESFEIRKEAVENFLKIIKKNVNVEIRLINHSYEPLLDEDLKVDAVFVTPQTYFSAKKINKMRKSVGMQELEIVKVPMELADDGKEISSTRIRNGEINRQGKVYVHEIWKNNKLILPKKLRVQLHRPIGNLINVIPKELDPKGVITIGDVTTQKFNAVGFGQFLSIIDFQVKRHKIFEKVSELGFDSKINIYKVDNPAGTITPELFKAIHESFKLENRNLILVNGEEDLAVLPMLLTAPLGFHIFYGQPNQGLVDVKVTSETKEKAYELINKFIN